MNHGSCARSVFFAAVVMLSLFACGDDDAGDVAQTVASGGNPCAAFSNCVQPLSARQIENLKKLQGCQDQKCLDEASKVMNDLMAAGAKCAQDHCKGSCDAYLKANGSSCDLFIKPLQGSTPPTTSSTGATTTGTTTGSSQGSTTTSAVDCILDKSCYSGNLYKARPAGASGCVDAKTCSRLWACEAAASGGRCGGGATQCVFSAGCSAGVQTCGAGLCTSLSSCQDAIVWDGLKIGPTSCGSTAAQTTGGPTLSLSYSGNYVFEAALKNGSGKTIKDIQVSNNFSMPTAFGGSGNNWDLNSSTHWVKIPSVKAAGKSISLPYSVSGDVTLTIDVQYTAGCVGEYFRAWVVFADKSGVDASTKIDPKAWPGLKC